MDQQPVCYAFGPFVLDTSRRVLENAGVPLALSPRGFDILRVLIEAQGRVLSRAELIDAVWAGVTVSDNNLDVQLSRLRQTLGESGNGAALIATVPGRGYCFAGALQPVAPHAAAAPEPRPRHVRRWILVPVTAAAALLLVIALLQNRGNRVPGADRLSIVVMPFRSLSQDRTDQNLADAVSDDLTTDLSHIPGSLVIARTSADTYKGRPVNATQVGRDLGVRYLLEGSIGRAGSAVRVNAQLIDAPTGTHVWADRFDNTPDPARDTEGDIVHRIASALQAVLVRSETIRAARERPNDRNALALFYQARALIATGDSLEQRTAAQRLLENAIAAQPAFLDAMTDLGILLLRKLASYDYAGYEKDAAEAHALIARAMALAPRDAAVLAAQGRLLEFDHRHAEARAAFDAAIIADPANVEARMGAAFSAWRTGDLPSVIEHVTAVQRIDPFGPLARTRYDLLGLATLFGGRAQEAIGILLKSEALSAELPTDANDATPKEFDRLYLMAAYAMAGDMAEAKRRYIDYKVAFPRRTVWRQMAFLTPAQSSLPHARDVEAALIAAGMPRFADEHADCAPPDANPAYGDFAQLPCAMAGAGTIDTAALRRLLMPGTTQSAPGSGALSAPAVVDVGLALAAVPGALLLSDEQAAGNRGDLLRGPFGSRLAAAGNQGIVVMSTGSSGSDGYVAARHFIEQGMGKIFWYRGGEEAWAQAGLPAEDRRPR